MNITILYTLFAVIATILNILSQDIFLRIYTDSYKITLSVLVGTAIGLLTKYILDKKYIFNVTTNNLLHDSKLFFQYTIMGIVTTFIFWGFEFGFEYLFATTTMRYIGGIIGLAIGYWIKYHLDKHFVFNKG